MNKLNLILIELHLFKWGEFHILSMSYKLISDELDLGIWPSHEHTYDPIADVAVTKPRSTAERNQDYFNPHFFQKLFSKKLCHAIYALDT